MPPDGTVAAVDVTVRNHLTVRLEAQEAQVLALRR